MTAFFALWRARFGTTNNIDGLYRNLMALGDCQRGVWPFSRSPKSQCNDSPQIDANALRNYMCLMLDDSGIGTKKQWTRRAARIPVYSASKPLTRLLLLAATHDTVPDFKQLGLIKAGNAGVLPLLSYEKWIDDGMVSVEHIAPQKPTKSGTATYI